MKEVTVKAWCDACAAEIADTGGDVEPATVEQGVSISPHLPRFLDLCERHHKSLIEPLAALLAEYGQAGPGSTKETPHKPHSRPGKDANEGDRYPCLWCPEAFGSSGGLKGHLERVHGLADGRGGAVFGTVCPLCMARQVGKTTMGTHARGAHGARSVAALFREAEAAGDPHAIVAAVKSKLGAPARKRTRKGTHS